MANFDKASLALHKKKRGKLETKSTFPLRDRRDLSIAYTPGVAAVSLLLAKHPEKAYDYSIKGHTVAVVSDGSAVLGLGDIGPLGALPVMEGKSVLFKELANIDAMPICIDVHDVDSIVATVRAIAPQFGGINLEDIAAPKCFEVEARLQDIGIPVFHDDQHGTNIVVNAALLNALRVVKKKLSKIKVVMSGAGAAGSAIARTLAPDVADILLVDRHGIIYRGRKEVDENKKQLARLTNKKNVRGTLADAFVGADVFIGVSGPGLVTKDMVSSMAAGSIVLSMANPIPEIMPDLAKAAGAVVVGTGRSDFPNQINNVLAFPGVFKGALAARAKRITPAMEKAAARALAAVVKKPTAENILPYPLDRRVVPVVARAVARAAK